MGCRAHLCHLSGLGQVGHSPKGNQWECWDPGQGPNVVGLPILLPPTIWPTHSLTGWYFVTWLVGWPIAAGKLAGWLTTYCTKCQPDPHLGRDILWPSVWLLWSHRPVVRCTLSRDISWSSLVLLWAGWPLVRCTPRQRYLVANCVTTMVRLTSGHMHPPPKDQALDQVDIWSGFWSCWPLVRCTPQRHLVAKCDTISGHCSQKPHFVFICRDK